MIKILIKNILLCIAVTFIGLTACATDNTPKPNDIPPITNADKLSISWDIGSLGSSSASSFAPVVDTNNSVFTADSNGNIYKIDSTDGTIITKFNIKRNLSSGCAISADSIFVTTVDNSLLSIGKVNEKVLWEIKLPTISIEPPQIMGNTIVVRTNDDSILAYNAETGALLWVYQRPVPGLTLRVTNTMQLVPSGGVLVVGLPSGRLVMLNLTNGTPIWENNVAVPQGATDLDKLTDIAMRPVLDDRMICVASFNGNLSCLDAISSNLIWSKKFSSSSQILIDNQNVYAISQDGTMYAFDKSTGASQWSNDVLKNRGLGSPAFLNNNILVVDDKGYINLFSRNDGQLIARVSSNLSGGTSYPWSNGHRVIMQSGSGNISSITQ